MMKLILTITILNLFSILSFGQTKTDSWYKFKSKSIEGYLHYTVKEDSLFINTYLDCKFKIEDKLISYYALLKNKKDSLITIETFDITGTTDNISNPQEYKILGHVVSKEKSQNWLASTDDGRTFKVETKKPTVADWNLFHLLTLLDYSKKGRILDFNSMEISELNYKENHYLEYLKDEELLVNGKKTQTRKIIHNGDGIRESTYWLDFNNNLIKISIDNYKNFEKCEKEDIEIEKYN